MCVCVYVPICECSLDYLRFLEGLTSSYTVDPETCHGVTSVGYRDRFQERLDDIAKQGFAVEITYPVEFKSV